MRDRAAPGQPRRARTCPRACTARAARRRASRRRAFRSAGRARPRRAAPRPARARPQRDGSARAAPAPTRTCARPCRRAYSRIVASSRNESASGASSRFALHERVVAQPPEHVDQRRSRALIATTAAAARSENAPRNALHCASTERSSCSSSSCQDRRARRASWRGARARRAGRRRAARASRPARRAARTGAAPRSAPRRARARAAHHCAEPRRDFRDCGALAVAQRKAVARFAGALDEELDRRGLGQRLELVMRPRPRAAGAAARSRGSAGRAPRRASSRRRRRSRQPGVRRRRGSRAARRPRRAGSRLLRRDCRSRSARPRLRRSRPHTAAVSNALRTHSEKTRLRRRSGCAGAKRARVPAASCRSRLVRAA